MEFLNETGLEAAWIVTELKPKAFALVVLAVALVWMGPSADWYSSVWQRLIPSLPSASVTLSQPPAQPANTAVTLHLLCTLNSAL